MAGKGRAHLEGGQILISNEGGQILISNEGGKILTSNEGGQFEANHFSYTVVHHMSLVTRKHVFGVCYQVRLKSVCSTKEAS